MKYVIATVVAIFAFAISKPRAEEIDPPGANKCKTFRAPKANFTEIRPGIWEGAVTGRYWEHPTGVILKVGQRVTIRAGGRICWEGSSRCVGPKGTRGVWGLSMSFNLFEFDYDSPKTDSFFEGTVREPGGELKFFIPEGRDGLWVPANCQYYSDNTGKYSVTITVTDPLPPTKEKKP